MSPAGERQTRVRRGAAPRGGASGRIGTYAARHAQVFFASLGQLSRTPLASLMTAAVIGIALAMPAGMNELVKHAQRLSGGWDSVTQVSLFLKPGTSATQADRLAQRLRKLPNVVDVDYISPEDALTEFQRLSGFGNALEALDENPLPGVLVVQPTLVDARPEASARLLEQLSQEPEVELAQLDMQWVKRLYAVMEIVQRGVLVLAALLALAVVLVVGNTIRLAIQNRRDEIVIIKLIGGTDAFIRRPFLYAGFWYGLFGGLIAYALVSGAMIALNGPVQRLAGLYRSQFGLHLPDLATVGVLVAGSIALALAGSWLAVGRHLRSIEPT